MTSSPLAKKLACAALVLIMLSSLVSAESLQDQVDTYKQHKHRSSNKTSDEWSSIMGWVSIACWVIVYTPQMHQNYVAKSAKGLSITFIIIWLAGDALNAAGAMMQGLLWTMIILALYYCLCDCVLIFQYWYYGKYYHRGLPIATISVSVEADERTPLVADGAVIEDDLESKEPDEDDWKRSLLMYGLAALIVVGTGVAAWWIAEKSHNGVDKPEPHPGHGAVGWRWDAQAYGWLSALLYLSSRVPQIIKNRTTKCEGLSLALFVFAVAGNTTYIASIIFKSTEREYLIENMSWLVGSLGTILLDFIVLGQFIAYRKSRKEIHWIRHASVISAGEEY